MSRQGTICQEDKRMTREIRHNLRIKLLSFSYYLDLFILMYVLFQNGVQKVESSNLSAPTILLSSFSTFPC